MFLMIIAKYFQQEFVRCGLAGVQNNVVLE